MNPDDYEFVSNFLQRASGLSLGSGKEYLVKSRLVPLAAALGFEDFNQLVSELRRGHDRRLSTAVTEAMTTNETSFFRDKTPFEDLKTNLIPALIKARSNIKKLKVWCAAASTGQEPYSFLMLLEEAFPELKQWSIELVATDIAQTMIDRSREGVYSQFEVQRGLPIQYLVKYFSQVSTGWQVKETLRQRVVWQQLNLLNGFDSLGPFDLVLCRNVLIYFEVPVKRDVLDRIAKRLHSDGFLLLGAAETVLGICDRFDRFKGCASAVYALRGPSTEKQVPTALQLKPQDSYAAPERLTPKPTVAARTT
jgi:chemotaxis protein methyltransferase CheR